VVQARHGNYRCHPLKTIGLMCLDCRDDLQRASRDLQQGREDLFASAESILAAGSE
jgi:hypothetical protein